MKKFKKFFAFTAVLAVFVSFGSTGAAAAEVTCPPHGPYEDRLLDISQGYEEHYVPYRDSDGNKLYDPVTQEPINTKCVVTQSRYYRGVYCTTCWKLIYDYRYEDPKRHSYSFCPEKKE